MIASVERKEEPIQMTKLDFLNEACEKTTCHLDLKCTDLTLLINACHEAATYRTEHKLPHAEKFTKMENRLRELSDDLDKKINAKSEWLLAAAREKAKNRRFGL